MSTTIIEAALSGPPSLLALDMGIGSVVGGAVAAGLGILFFLILVKNFLYICRPNEILIFTGRKRYDAEGNDLGPMIIMGHGPGEAEDRFPGLGRGRAWRVPIVERVDRMDITEISTDIVVQNAYSKGNIPLRIHAIANVKIHGDPQLIRNAIERFLGRSRQEIQVVAQQTLEGAVREVLAQMTPEQVNEDRLRFADELIDAAKDDLDKLGLQLDTLKIQSVSDDTGYLDSLGRPQIAAALRDAENAENQAQQEITEAQATANQRAQVGKAEAETQILMKRNEVAKVKAELDGNARAVEEEASAAAKTARAEAERKLQEVRKALEHLRLQAEVVIPADIRRQAEAIKAKGDAAPTIENGAAVVEVLRRTSEAWKTMGGQAQEIWVIQHLEEIIGTVVGNMKGIEVQEVSVLDPGDGSGLSSYAAAYPQTVAAILRALKETTGVDVPAILGGRAPQTNAPGIKPPAGPGAAPGAAPKPELFGRSS
jgi:flotillin